MEYASIDKKMHQILVTSNIFQILLNIYLQHIFLASGLVYFKVLIQMFGSVYYIDINL